MYCLGVIIYKYIFQIRYDKTIIILSLCRSQYDYKTQIVWEYRCNFSVHEIWTIIYVWDEVALYLACLTECQYSYVKGRGVALAMMSYERVL